MADFFIVMLKLPLLNIDDQIFTQSLGRGRDDKFLSGYIFQ